MKLDDLSGHPDNNNIYDPTDLTDLEQSLSAHGQLEPIAITKDKRIISGHRRFAAMKSLGWTECEVRIVEPDNEIIALIEHNRHRQKTKGDILREAKFLELEPGDTVSPSNCPDIAAENFDALAHCARVRSNAGEARRQFVFRIGIQ